MPRNTRATIAMLCIGLAVFSCLYSTQAILPELVSEVGLSSTAAALTVSAATGALAVCVVPASILSERFGRGRILLVSCLAATLVGFTVPWASSPALLIGLRALQGALMAGAPAVAMAWLSEELDARALPRAMGLYIAGTSIGGLMGRLIPSGLLELTSWRWALGGSALVSFLFAVAAAFLLPKQHNFTAKTLNPRREFAAMLEHWRTKELGLLFLVALLAMGSFVSVYNFISFRLIETFGLPQALVSFVFLLYLFGTWSSAQAGKLAAKHGRGTTLLGACVLFGVGIALTLGPLVATIAGMLLLTVGFFAAHSTASGWVGAVANHDRAEASSMYVFCYYFGSSVLGAFAGTLFGAFSWATFVGFYVLVSVILIAIAATLKRRAVG
ncbi:MFS transporter [Corynebacterium sp. HMSC04H06]|uniref:MFS transporter n=1 Tax=Corynebacterium sp. HMSC04H06 TaxID=1581050 RepID=UPI0008A4FA1A|nr:MFS transporter [Corynebacterium sp. HMSC04H06]OFS20324.1 hypothetical protein HMPREF3067_07690 [Corynebacterium sp. HMSC04H06]